MVKAQATARVSGPTKVRVLATKSGQATGPGLAKGSELEMGWVLEMELATVTGRPTAAV